MKKLLIGVVVLGLVAGGGWLYWNQQKAAQLKMADRFHPSPAQLYSGIVGQVTPVFDLHGYKIAMLVPGDRIEGDGWVFRGTARSGNLSPAYYGQVDYVCSVSQKTSDQCWKLSQLVVDGRALAISAADQMVDGVPVDTEKAIETRESEALGMNNALDTQNGSAADTAILDAPTQGEGSTAQSDTADITGASDIAATPVTPGSSEARVNAKVPVVPDGAEAEAAAAAAGSADVWRTTSGNVNARMGPGTDFEVAFAMPETTPLRLLEQKNGWGRFAYAGPDGKTYRVWIYMTLVAKN